MIEVDAVRKTFTVGIEEIRAVDGASLTCKPGQFICLYGASGSGKSTLLGLIGGLDVPDSGSLRVNDRAIEGLNDRERASMRLHEVGLVFQDHNLLSELSAAENVALPLLARGMSATEARAEAQRTLGAVGIADLVDRRPAEMSGGQRQRVGIARALATGGSILLADEPTGALDRQNSIQLFALFRRLADDFGCAVLVATHDPLGRDYATDVLTMVDGRLDQ